jgi:hypothetical protein
MNYLNIFETRYLEEFEKIKAEFDEANIKYKVLYEYRLYPENDFGEMGGGAMVQVAQKDLIKANHLLTHLGLVKRI